MSDPKIHEMFAAWNADAMKQRSVGEVAAPRFTTKCPCGTVMERIGPPMPHADYLCTACFSAAQSDNAHELSERQATLAERAAVVKYLRNRASLTFGQAELWLLGAASDIEKGDHIP